MNPQNLGLIFFAIWILGFACVSALSITFPPEVTTKKGTKIPPREQAAILAIMCVFWFVFFPSAIIDHIKRKD